MTIMNLLTVISIAAVINNLVNLVKFFTVDSNNKKKHEILDRQEDHIISGYNGNVNGYNYKGMSNMNKQIVYKVDGDFVGDIKGDNVTVILMGDGDFVGDINSKDGEVVLIKGNINGDVKANKIVCPTKHNPAKDVESPKLPVKTMLSCDIPQGRIDHYTSIGNRVSVYGSSPVTHITCPHCKKHFATQLRVQTSVVDGDVVEIRVGEIKRDY